jgi:hypothetical protein
MSELMEMRIRVDCYYIKKGGDWMFIDLSDILKEEREDK